MSCKLYAFPSFEKDALGLLYIYDKSERSTIKGKELTELLKKNGII